MYRRLGIFERAMLVANQHAPFNIVSVLRLANAPSPEVVRQALIRLQHRHPFLRAMIRNQGQDLIFEERDASDFHFEVVERSDPAQWQEYTHKEMAHRFDQIKGPLFRAVYLSADGFGDLILNFHHGIADAASVMNLLEELLQVCAGIPIDLPPLAPISAPEDRFPDLYKGVNRLAVVGRYAILQMSEMASYVWRTRKKRTPTVRLGGAGKLATLVLPEDLVDQLSRIGRSNGVTLNSLLNAAQLLAVNRHLYANQPLPMRTFSFADLRPYTTPPTQTRDFGNYVSMMGFMIDVLPEEDFWAFAGRLHSKIYRGFKRGDKFTALLMSEALLKMFTRMESMRFGATALNFNSYVPLKLEYGDIQVLGFHGFVSGYDLGPEMAAQARLFNNQVWWDFIYLDTDMDAATAAKIVDEIV